MFDLPIIFMCQTPCFRMTFVITHGYLEHGKKNWLQEMKDELLKNGDHNVLIVVRKWID